MIPADVRRQIEAMRRRADRWPGDADRLGEAETELVRLGIDRVVAILDAHDAVHRAERVAHYRADDVP